MRNIEIAKKAVITKAALFGLYEEYSIQGSFNMDRLTRVERLLDDILALALDRNNIKTYPNPCSEILLAGAGGVCNRMT